MTCKGYSNRNQRAAAIADIAKVFSKSKTALKAGSLKTWPGLRQAMDVRCWAKKRVQHAQHYEQPSRKPEQTPQISDHKIQQHCLTITWTLRRPHRDRLSTKHRPGCAATDDDYVATVRRPTRHDVPTGQAKAADAHADPLQRLRGR